MLNIVLLSGGSGKRLWPLSNEVRSKQFLKIFNKADGSPESMVQRMYRMIYEVDGKATVTVATSENQVAQIYAQLGNAVGVSVEPCRRDTFPAIALASSYLHDIRGIGSEEIVIVCPVDPYVEIDYFQMLERLHFQAAKGEANLVLMGIEPTYPSEEYGYIIPQSEETVSIVEAFKEKPDAATAESYIKQGALWNGGVFAFKLRYVLQVAKRTFGTANYDWLRNHFSSLPKISFDYAVAEKEERIQVIRFAGQWKDLGTWKTFTEAMEDNVSGSAIVVDCINTHVINKLRIPLIALGVKNLAIAATPDGILVSDKMKSDQLKDYVNDQRPMYEERAWGEYKVLDYRIQKNGQNFLTKHLVIGPGRHISYQRHWRRIEMWAIVDGTGKLILENEVRPVRRGDSAYIKQGMKHAIKADTELHIIEVQVGDELTEDDIERLEWDWDYVN